MVRKAQSPPVTTQMYRHFAVLTLAVTAAVAVFADGENREAVAGEVARAQHPTPAAGPTELARKDTKPRGSFGAGDGFDGSFGQPMDTEGAIPQDGIVPGEFAAKPRSGVPAGYTIYGVSAEVWARMTDAEKKAVMARLEAERAAARSPDRAGQIDGLLAASRARAGAATPAD